MKDKKEAQVYVRFETVSEDRYSQPLGPFPFVQATYSDLRVGPDGREIAFYDSDYGAWFLRGQESDDEWWSDFVVYAEEG